MKARMCAAALGLALFLPAAGASAADVLDMPGGLTSLQTVPVDSTGNLPDTRYETPGYGAVDYDYAIGMYEVTAGQYVEFLNAVAGVDSFALYNTNMWTGVYGCKIERYAGSGTGGEPYQYRVASESANRPVNYVSWGDAARFANWLHNDQRGGPQDSTTTEDGSYALAGATSDAALLAILRESDATWVIPTESEWYKAAYHKNDGATGNYFQYPTSADTAPSNALTDPDPGNHATYFDTGDTIGSPHYRTEAGAHEASASPYGTLDMGGNVWEWTEAVIADDRGSRGGSFTHYVGSLHASTRTPHAPTLESYSLGFRVAQVPEPASGALLLAGALALVRRRRSKRWVAPSSVLA